MQLTRHTSIRGALTVAACAVIAGEAQASSAPPEDGWSMDTSLFYYSEQGRISVVEPAVLAKKWLGEDETLTVRAVYDSMTGSTPNGSTVSSKDINFQTSTATSGGGTNVATETLKAGTLPVAKFRDTRVSVGFDWDKRTSRLVDRVLGFNISRESDYMSLGTSATYAIDSDNRLTTYTLGLGFSYDLVSPKGGAPKAMTQRAKPGDTLTGASGLGGGGGGVSLGIEGEKKTILDLMVGVTRVIDRKTLAQFNYSHGMNQGYLNDPYKMLSMVDTNGDVITDVFGNNAVYFYEKRPSSRNTNSLFTKVVHQFDEDVLNISYRYYWDDWGITSHTVDAKYRYELTHDLYLQPHARYYTQTAADFFKSFLRQGAAVPTYASPDLRLGQMDSIVTGLRIGYEVGQDEEIALRLEQMVQTGTPSDLVGSQKAKDIYPDLKATMAEITYSFTF